MILDTTLREGLQRVGAYLPLRDRMALAEALLAAGIPELELGVLGRDGTLERLLQGLLPQTSARLWVWGRLRPEDAELAASMGARSVALCAPATADHLRVRLGWSPEELPERIFRAVTRGVQLGLEVSVGLEDASRAGAEDLLRYAGAARSAGAMRVRIADTVGVLSPGEVAELVAAIRSIGLEVGFHGHDDFGMATANALAALDAGASAVDASLLGWGERAGITGTERLAAFLVARRGAPFALDRICQAARDLAGRGGIEIPDHAPVVGRAIFRCETGLHVAAIARQPSLYEPFPPELVGATRELQAGGKIGIAGLRQILSNSEVPVEVDGELVTKVRRAAERLGRPLRPGELERLARAA